MSIPQKYFSNHWSTIFYNPAYLIRSNLFKEIRVLAPELSGNLLDFGCGSKPYKNLFINASSYVGLDYNIDKINGGATGSDLDYNGKDIPCADGVFDSVISTEVFEHLFNLEDNLREIRRVMKPKGLLLFTCPFALGEHEVPFDFARYTSFGLKFLVEKNGFEMIYFNKTGSSVSVIFQFIAIYINHFLAINKYLKIFLFPILISPFFILSNILTYLLPNKILRKDLYLNNIVLCKKI